jgi:hypothetical protein
MTSFLKVIECIRQTVAHKFWKLPQEASWETSCRCKNSIAVGLKVIACEDVNWSEVTKRVQWQALVNAVMTFRFFNLNIARW